MRVTLEPVHYCWCQWTSDNTSLCFLIKGEIPACCEADCLIPQVVFSLLGSLLIWCWSLPFPLCGLLSPVKSVWFPAGLHSAHMTEPVQPLSLDFLHGCGLPFTSLSCFECRKTQYLSQTLEDLELVKCLTWAAYESLSSTSFRGYLGTRECTRSIQNHYFYLLIINILYIMKKKKLSEIFFFL